MNLDMLSMQKFQHMGDTKSLDESDRSTNTKIKLFWGRGKHMDRRSVVPTNGQTYRRTKGRGVTFNMSTYHLSNVSAVQFNATLKYSAVQHCSRLVHQQIQESFFLIKLSSSNIAGSTGGTTTARNKVCLLMC